MKGITISLAAALIVVCGTAFAGIKPCEELKSEVEAKLNEKGVKSFMLEIVPADQIKGQKVVGSCDGGTKKITYTRDTEKKSDKK